jgi:hypothetical protein
MSEREHEAANDQLPDLDFFTCRANLLLEHPPRRQHHWRRKVFSTPATGGQRSAIDF